MTVKIGHVPVDKVPNIWPDVLPGIEHVQDMYDNNWNSQAVYNKIIGGQWWLVIATNEGKLIGVFVCAPIQYPAYTTLCVHIGVGQPMSLWRDPLIEFMKNGAKSIGASKIEWRGRKGFMKAFADVATIKHVSMVIDVESENG